MLVSLRQTLAEDYRDFDESYHRVLTAEDCLTALYKLVELTPTERLSLDLPAGDGLTLLQRALLILQTVGGLENYEMLLRLYKAAVGLDFTQAEVVLNNLAEVDDLIAESVREALGFLPQRSSKGQGEDRLPGREETILELTRKAQREIRRILARSGNQQFSVTGGAIVDSYVRHYLQPAFVKKLAQSIVANERLTDQFPVYLKRITLTASGPLPFADRELDVLTQAQGPYPPLLHPVLRQLDQQTSLNTPPELPGPGDYELASQEATQVTVEFYIKVPSDYQPMIQDRFESLASQDQQRIDFTISSTGIGGALSHVIKVINLALLQDIHCLRNYFPIAHDVTSTQAIIRDNVASPVWAHSLVKLCHKPVLGETLKACQDNEFKNYEEFAFGEPIGHGDYCGFDFLLSQVQASLQARLQAIRNAGIRPNQYIQQLCQRVERLKIMQDAQTYLRGYPFSSLAMIGIIEQNILPAGPTPNAPLQKTDPYVYFEACLSIAEALLDEGIYRPVRAYLRRLEVMDEFVDQGLETSQSDFTTIEVFSGSLIIRYLICLANYYYLYDTEDRTEKYLPPGCQTDVNREVLVQRAWSTLNQAQQHVSLRLRKYVVINEVSQGTFHPHYLLLSQIAYLRTKLLLFFPQWVPTDEICLPTESFSGRLRTEASIHWGRLYLAEKARLYAAADGESEVYACYAAMQSWLYLIAAYAGSEKLTLIKPTDSDRVHRPQLSPKQCFDWARQLRDHALVAYAETGQQCYYQVKEKSGLARDIRDEFGSYQIEKIPPIYEARGQQYIQWSQSEQELLVLDMSLLAVNPKDLPKLSPHHPTQNIYLFGTNACYLFFARGLYVLCTNEADEFGATESLASEIDWDAKLLHAMRLLNTAWAIAEEGGEVTKDQQDGERVYHISRSFSSDRQPSRFSYPEIDAIRDLYPRRITEIADLGKIFAVACMVLRLGLLPPADQAALESDIESLLDNVHNAQNLQRSRTQRALIQRQKRYNGHLEAYLNRAKACLQKHKNLTHQTLDMAEKRDALIKDLFSGLLMP
ncbi:MAG: hypothetical protein HC922_07035 [Leptolyngbyaceae cyanobacterium SM2_3_12]|nr:hypothetical protein [Leptolyngbyaceae cyanobacterium SM2_3_12]